MTMKYLWLLGILPDGISENDLHIPVDRYIIDALHEKSFIIPETAWSTWDINAYCGTFRNKNDFSKSNITLEWENIAWIEQAELKKKSKKEKKYSEFFKEDTTVIK